MNRVYQKSELGFALCWIAVYVAGASIADAVSEKIGVAKLITFIFLFLLSGTAFVWLKKQKLFFRYGLCRTGFVILYHRGKSLLPCIVTHSVLNALSTFANEADMTLQRQVLDSVLLTIIAVVYTWVLLKTLPASQEAENC